MRLSPLLLALSADGFEVSRLKDEIKADDCSKYEALKDDPIAFLKKWNEEAQPFFNAENVASWAQATDINPENEEKELQAQKESAAWSEVIGRCAVEYFGKLVTDCIADDSECTLMDEDCKECDGSEFGVQAWTKAKQLRGLKMLQDLGTAILGADSEEFQKYQSSLASMGTVYSSEKVKDQNSERMHPLDPDMTAIMDDQAANGENSDCAWEKQKYYWDKWNTQVGTQCINDYETFVEMSNLAAVKNGFQDTGDSWRSNYEDENFRANLEEVWLGRPAAGEDPGWRGVKELYELIHGYIRHRLNKRYGDERVSKSTDPVPAHIFGNMWAQTWGSLYDLAAPFPEAGDRPDATPEIEKLTEEEMFKFADEFFSSLEMTPMTDTFWKESVIKKKPGVDMVCHASAWDFMAGDGNHDDGKTGDYRIKQCTVKNQDDFVTIHHEMGHIQYYQQYAHHPIIFRSGGNPGFHEAIGDTLALAVSTPKHLQAVGLLPKDIPEGEEADLNYLMSILLDKITFLPFGYLMDLYRWDIFDGTVDKSEYQAHWEKLRLEYQGIISPNDRSTIPDAFDAAGKYHIPNNTPYIRYFISFIVQFQFYEKMCIEAGQYDPMDEHSDPLYKCDFYNSKEAGAALRNILQKGQSQEWQLTLAEFLCENDGSCVGEMNPTSLINYFQPIIDWLEADQEEHKWVTGWDVESTWKPCGYSDATEPCPQPEKPCSTDEDWDASWDNSAPDESTSQAPDVETTKPVDTPNPEETPKPEDTPKPEETALPEETTQDSEVEGTTVEGSASSIAASLALLILSVFNL